MNIFKFTWVGHICIYELFGGCQSEGQEPGGGKIGARNELTTPGDIL